VINQAANAQFIDTSSQISNQVDANVAETLTGETSQPPNAPTTGQGFTAYTQKPGPRSIYSGYGKEGKWDFCSNVILIEGFNEKNSFIGKGVTDAYSSQLGFSIKSPFGTTIQPFVSYQYASTDLQGANTAHANTYGASLNLSQKIIPFQPVFHDHQSGAVRNIGDQSKDVFCQDVNAYRDHYPNYDVTAGLNISYGDANLATFKKGWAYDTQDGYGITPSFSFDYFRKRAATDGGFDGLPDAVSIVPSYAYLSTDGMKDESSSAGLLSIQDRNTYLFVLEPKSDCDQTPIQTLQLIESNTLFHDTNQELIAASTGPIAYQNWARFGLALEYTNTVDPKRNLPVAKIEYDYDAFNAQYQAHTVMLTINFRCW